MDDKGLWQLSWPALFTITGVSFLLFSLAIKMLDNVFPPLILRAGIIALALGIISWLLTRPAPPVNREEGTPKP
jgi:hypothetical protein